MQTKNMEIDYTIYNKEYMESTPERKKEMREEQNKRLKKLMLKLKKTDPDFFNSLQQK